MVLGFAELRLPSTGSCTTADSCCCGDPVTVGACVCGDHPASDFPELAGFSGMPNMAAPTAEELLIGGTTSLADLAPRWHPALPWHAPPEEKRTRLSVWIL